MEGEHRRQGVWQVYTVRRQSVNQENNQKGKVKSPAEIAADGELSQPGVNKAVDSEKQTECITMSESLRGNHDNDGSESSSDSPLCW